MRLYRFVKRMLRRELNLRATQEAARWKSARNLAKCGRHWAGTEDIGVSSRHVHLAACLRRLAYIGHHMLGKWAGVDAESCPLAHRQDIQVDEVALSILWVIEKLNSLYVS